MRCSAQRCTADPGPPWPGTIPGLQRTTSCCAAPGTRLETALRTHVHEIGGAVAGDARGEIDLPGEILAHRRGLLARALVGLEPRIHRLVRHPRLVGRQRMAGGAPGSVATVERAHPTLDERSRLAQGAAG